MTLKTVKKGKKDKERKQNVAANVSAIKVSAIKRPLQMGYLGEYVCSCSVSLNIFVLESTVPQPKTKFKNIFSGFVYIGINSRYKKKKTWYGTVQ